MSKEHLIHRRTCIYNVNYHIVWSVKYRRKVLNAKIESYLKDVHSS
ncbi:MAG: transposase [Ruminiclostridium sp.]